jgi:hypothetical protein
VKVIYENLIAAIWCLNLLSTNIEIWSFWMFRAQELELVYKLVLRFKQEEA